MTGRRSTDPSSASFPEDVVTKELKFIWSLDFTTKTIRGTAQLSIEWLKPELTDYELVLDVNELVIKSILVNDKKVEWTVTPNPMASMGAALKIAHPKAVDKSVVTIDYETSPTSAALQWLDACMTADGLKPFVFSQCQATLARALFPCQDTPQVKCPYSAVVHAPPDVTVLMGAQRDSEPTVSDHGDGWLVYTFKQPVPVPSYLVALACGALASEKISDRCSVWAEPSVVGKAAYEFADAEKMLQLAESFCGPYEWGIYDVLVLPPTFPYGGMENPCLTFVTPTLLAGDRSLATVVAHEIAHSWTGNLVTNVSWEHFWLNEGHTKYLERLIMERLQSTEMRELLITLGFRELEDEIERLGATNQLTKLVPCLDNLDPDEAYSRVPYEKGSLLLYYLEREFGRDKMMAWLRAYLKKFAMLSLDTNTWLNFLATQLGPEVHTKVDWEKWLHTPGLPPWKPKFAANALFKQCDDMTGLFMSKDLDARSTNLRTAWNQLNCQQREISLNQLLQNAPINHANLKAIDSILHLSAHKNAEIRMKWSMTCVRSQYIPALNSCLEFLNSQGRMKYTRPLYREFMKWPEVKERVLDNFATKRPTMHRTTAMLVAIDVGQSSKV